MTTNSAIYRTGDPGDQEGEGWYASGDTYSVGNGGVRSGSISGFTAGPFATPEAAQRAMHNGGADPLAGFTPVESLVWSAGGPVDPDRLEMLSPRATEADVTEPVAVSQRALYDATLACVTHHGPCDCLRLGLATAFIDLYQDSRGGSGPVNLEAYERGLRLLSFLSDDDASEGP